jgi:mono/diheme cytochrome c family protein
MLEGCRVDERTESTGFVLEGSVSGNSFGDATSQQLSIALAAACLNRAALAVFALALFFPTYAQADGGPDSYKAHCSACHGATGAGDTMIGKNLKLRPLTSAEVQDRSDDELFAIISKGRNRMPAFDRKLSKDQIRDVVRYLHLLKK